MYTCETCSGFKLLYFWDWLRFQFPWHSWLATHLLTTLHVPFHDPFFRLLVCFKQCLYSVRSDWLTSFNLTTARPYFSSSTKVTNTPGLCRTVMLPAIQSVALQMTNCSMCMLAWHPRSSTCSYSKMFVSVLFQLLSCLILVRCYFWSSMKYALNSIHFPD